MKENNFTILYCVCKNFCDTILFYYGSGSAKAKGYGSDSTTLFLTIKYHDARDKKFTS